MRPEGLDRIEEQVWSALDRLELKGMRDSEATHAIKEALSEVGHHLGYRVLARDIAGTEGGEWLFDLTWTEETSGQPRWLLRLPLVVESEWSVGGASDDFQKIMVARAEHRLMVMHPQSGSGKGAQRSIDDLIAEVQHFAMSSFGDRYLFACWDESEGSLVWRLHVVGSVLNHPR